MTFPKETATLLIVTIVTVLVWLLAAAKTREVDTIAGRLDLSVASDSAGDRFQVSPDRIPISVTLEGPAIAVREARQLLTSSRLPISLPAEHGRMDIESLAEEVRAVERIRSSGVAVVAVEPPTLTVDVTEFVERKAVTRARFPEAASVQDISITPQEVAISIPMRQIHDMPETLTAEATVDQRDLMGLEPGVLHTLDATLSIVDGPSQTSDLTITPATARVSFRLVARHRILTIPRVRIQIASAPEDFGAWSVTVPQPFLENVEIEASLEIMEAVEQGRAPVVAIVHLTTSEKERTIDSKVVSFFAVVDSDGVATPVAGSAAGESHPTVSLEITRTEP